MAVLNGLLLCSCVALFFGFPPKSLRSLPVTETWNEISLRHRRRAGRSWAQLTIVAAMLMSLHADFARAQIIDCTVSGELADMPGVERLALSYHLWSLDGKGELADSKWWAAAEAKVKAGERVGLNIEPDVSPKPEWRRPVDPKFASVGDVAKTHATIAARLEPLCNQAVKTGAEIWTYRLLSPTHKRGEDIAGKDPRPWQAHVKQLCDRRVTPHKSLDKMLAETKGGELFEVYIPDQWNVDRPWAITKCVLLLERQAAALEANGVRGIPLLNFYTVSKREPVRPEIMQALIFVAKQRGPVAVWNGWGEYSAAGKALPKITPAQKALLR